jgi:exodeoxyribonuclease X
MPRYIVVDTETTGPTANDAVCEIAWVEIDQNLNELALVHSLIDPQMRISASASGVHGITQDMVEDAPTIEEFFEHLQPQPEGSYILIAHNVRFDRPRIEPHLPEVSGQVCTLRLARRYLPNAENHKLSTLAYQYGLDRGDSHRADGDVRTCLSLLRYITHLSGLDLDTIVEAEKSPVIIKEMPFGTHRGVPMHLLDKGYARWALRNMSDLDPDLKHTLTLRAEGKL